MSTKFGLLTDFDLLKAATSTNAKPEIVLSGRGRHLDKAIRRLNRSNTISGFAFVDIAAFRFRFRPFARNLHIILHQAMHNFVQIEALTTEI